MITLYTFGPMFGLADPSPFVTKSLVTLKMSGLPFKIEAGAGALNKAPKGKLPFINDDGTAIADSTFIRFHLKQKHGVDLDNGLTREQRATGWALEKMCDEHLYWTVVDSRWMIKENFDKGPRHFFDAAPAPLRSFIIAKLHRDTKRTLHGQGMGRHTRSQIETLAKRDLDAISDVLGDRPFCSGPNRIPPTRRFIALSQARYARCSTRRSKTTHSRSPISLLMRNAARQDGFRNWRSDFSTYP